MALFRKTQHAPATTVAGDSVLGGMAPGGRAVRHITPKRWSIAGALVGVIAALIAFAPASWLSRALACHQRTPAHRRHPRQQDRKSVV